MDRQRVFMHSEDAELAVMLVRLDPHGVTGFWVTVEAGEKLAQISERMRGLRSRRHMDHWRTEEERESQWWRPQYVGEGKSPSDGLSRRS